MAASQPVADRDIAKEQRKRADPGNDHYGIEHLSPL
jgi:hypothetical protein